MKTLNWPMALGTTFVLYLITILTLPINSRFATITVFATIAYWSRLPGVSIPVPFYVLYQADVVDIFMLFIAIHVSPIYGIFFAIFCNFASRSAGIFPSWPGICQDTIILSVIALIAPLLYSLTNQNMLLVVAIYSVLRIFGFIILGFLWPLRSIPQLFIEESGAAVAVFAINMFYAKVFGNFFENIIQNEFSFNWILFFIVTVVVLIIAIIMLKISPARTAKRIVKKVVHKPTKKISKFRPDAYYHNSDDNYDNLKKLI